MATNEHSGFPLKWFKDQDSARNCYECAVCLEVLRDAVQVSECGHQFCDLCIDDILKTDPRCPTCRIAISTAMIFKDHAANRLIRKLEVSCCNQGCIWAGSLSSYVDDHVNSCPLSVCNAISCSDNEVIKNLEEQFKSLKLEFSSMKEKHEKDLTALKEQHEKNIRGLKQQINQLRAMSNGSATFIMKIPDFTRKLACANSTNSTGTIYSTPFHSSSYGYKMMLEVVLNEAHSGYPDYMGVFVVLMKGDYDGMLTWPFPHTITVAVVDQQDDEGLRRDHVQKMVPNGEPEFQRPWSDKNRRGRGFKRFILHSNICSRRYTKDDVVYIKIYVDTTSHFS